MILHAIRKLQMPRKYNDWLFHDVRISLYWNRCESLWANIPSYISLIRTTNFRMCCFPSPSSSALHQRYTGTAPKTSIQKKKYKLVSSSTNAQSMEYQCKSQIHCDQHDKLTLNFDMQNVHTRIFQKNDSKLT